MTLKPCPHCGEKELRKDFNRDSGMVETYRVNECLYEIDRLQAELAEEHKKYLLASSDRDNMDAEIQRLRKLARALSGYVLQRDITRETAQLGEIGPIVEDKA